MKRIAYLLLMLMAVFSFSACSSDADDDSAKTDKYHNTLIGKWRLASTNEFINQYYSGKAEPVEGNIYLTLNADGTCSLTGSAYKFIDDVKSEVLLPQFYGNAKTWQSGTTSSKHDYWFALNYYNDSQKRNDYVGFLVDFVSNDKINVWQEQMEEDYYTFERVK